MVGLAHVVEVLYIVHSSLYLLRAKCTENDDYILHSLNHLSNVPWISMINTLYLGILGPTWCLTTTAHLKKT